MIPYYHNHHHHLQQLQHQQNQNMSNDLQLVVVVQIREIVHPQNVAITIKGLHLLHHWIYQQDLSHHQNVQKQL